MDYFESAMDTVAIWEGGWSDHKDDPGGLTRWGWTLKTLVAKAIDVNMDGRVDARDLHDLTKSEARRLYRVHFWDAISGDLLPGPLAMLVFNSTVNQGPGRAAKFLQRAAGVKRDGAIGPRTLAAVSDKWNADPLAIMREFLTWQLLHYTSLAIFVTFGRGWTRRTMDFALVAGGEAATMKESAIEDVIPHGTVTVAPVAPHRRPSTAWERIVAALSGGRTNETR
ncbi:hypothetical protein KX928_17395 [Roseobacter sp. YSTF-M11]|uniref:Secretion activator protein n=1 Tax=Roseobacter insulae TaxID=2859783 RepID=A0A9X1FY92_9RHOB|nr:glycosyl hydrolase 108 family protein [Roseobacter insulae]MBW4709564.1 hypothetical protein [Roseobacter insulae]